MNAPYLDIYLKLSEQWSKERDEGILQFLRELNYQEFTSLIWDVVFGSGAFQQMSFFDQKYGDPKYILTAGIKDLSHSQRLFLNNAIYGVYRKVVNELSGKEKHDSLMSLFKMMNTLRQGLHTGLLINELILSTNESISDDIRLEAALVLANHQDVTRVPAKFWDEDLPMFAANGHSYLPFARMVYYKNIDPEKAIRSLKMQKSMPSYVKNRFMVNFPFLLLRATDKLGKLNLVNLIKRNTIGNESLRKICKNVIEEMPSLRQFAGRLVRVETGITIIADFPGTHVQKQMDDISYELPLDLKAQVAIRESQKNIGKELDQELNNIFEGSNISA